jgi:hypothetical protein
VAGALVVGLLVAVGERLGFVVGRIVGNEEVLIVDKVVGREVGNLLISVGWDVGCMFSSVGSNVGCVFSSVGCNDGCVFSSEGCDVGADDCSRVGVSVGTYVGRFEDVGGVVGITVDFELGLDDGCIVGLGDEDEGLLNGYEVGWSVGWVVEVAVGIVIGA